MNLEPLFRADIALAPIRELGGGRRVIALTGGTAPRFETGDARYAWLNRIVCVASGVRRPASVEIDVYEVK